MDATSGGTEARREAVRRALTDVVRSQPVSDDPERLEGYLRDLCPAQPAEVSVVVVAAKARVPAELSGARPEIPLDAVVARLANRLHTEEALDRGLAQWAVESWAIALGRLAVAPPPAAAPAPPVAAPPAAGVAAPARTRARPSSPPPSTPLAVPGPARPRPRVPTGVAAVAGIVLVGIVVAGLVLANRGSDEPEDEQVEETVAETAETTVPTVPPTVPPRQIDQATITAVASSTLPDEPTFTFGIRNTLDGNLGTAWNDGAPGAGEGERLTYQFQAPVRLTTITFVNGWVASQQLYEINARMRDIVIVTDGGRFPVTLADRMDRQQIDRDFGRTTSVVIEVTSVYRGTRFEDLALSEIEFFGTP